MNLLECRRISLIGRCLAKKIILIGTCLLNLRILIGTCLLNLGILIGRCLLKSAPFVFELVMQGELVRAMAKNGSSRCFLTKTDVP